MTEISKISIVASFVGLWITSLLKNDLQIIVGFLLILSFGILHGANDLVLLKKIKKNKNKTFLSLLLSYLLVVFISALIFIFIPWIALIVFVLVSAYHFGEQHWQELENYKWNWLKPIFYFVYGIVILLLLFQFHYKEVQKIIFGITQYHVGFINNSTLLLIFGVLLLILMAYNYYESPKFRKTFLNEMLYLLIFGLIFKMSSLIWGFTIYFILWHSIPSLNDQIKFLYGNYSFNNFKLYFKSAYIYWIVSLLGISILYYFLNEKKIFDAIFFSFLAAITFPHAFVILKMFKK